MLQDISLANCYCHILHNGVKWSHQLLPIDIEKFLMSTYSHFSRSAKRITELKTYYEFYEQDFHVRFLIDSSPKKEITKVFMTTFRF